MLVIQAYAYGMKHDPRGGAHAEDFQRDGAVLLKGVVAPALVDLLRKGIDDNIAAPSPRAKIASGADDPGRFIEDFCNWRTNLAYRRFIFDSGLAEIAGELIASSVVRLYHDHMLTKDAGTAQRTPWHQDQPYYNIEGRQTVSFWIPVDPSRRRCGGRACGRRWRLPATRPTRGSEASPDRRRCRAGRQGCLRETTLPERP